MLERANERLKSFPGRGGLTWLAEQVVGREGRVWRAEKAAGARGRVAPTRLSKPTPVPAR